MSIQIPLRSRSGEVLTYARVDEEDAAMAQLRWYLHSGGYAARSRPKHGPNPGTDLLHRVILQAPPGLQVDHINGNRLDCRRANLRLVTEAQNHQNVPARRGTSKYRGVCYEKRWGYWTAQVKANGAKRHLGSFATEEEAALAASVAREQLLTHANEHRHPIQPSTDSGEEG